MAGAINLKDKQVQMGIVGILIMAVGGFVLGLIGFGIGLVVAALLVKSVAPKKPKKKGSLSKEI